MKGGFEPPQPSRRNAIVECSAAWFTDYVWPLGLPKALESHTFCDVHCTDVAKLFQQNNVINSYLVHVQQGKTGRLVWCHMMKGQTESQRSLSLSRLAMTTAELSCTVE